MIQKLESDEPNTWIYVNGFQDLTDGELYIRAFYFTVTTITTVGFGDISPGTDSEMIFGVVVMICGVIAFSYATGSLSSLLQNLDNSTEKLNEKINVLNDIREHYNIGPVLYEELRQAIQYEVEKDVSNIVALIDSLPHRLKMDLSVKIHREIICHIPFFKNRPNEVVAFIGPLLKPLRFKENDYVYTEGESATKLFFLTKGLAGFVLPEFKNLVYITIEIGDHFGTIDKFGRKRDSPSRVHRRAFTVMALENCEVMELSFKDLAHVEESYPEIYYELVQHSDRRYTKVMRIKEEAIKEGKKMHKIMGTTRMVSSLTRKDTKFGRTLNNHNVLSSFKSLTDVHKIAEIDSDSLERYFTTPNS